MVNTPTHNYLLYIIPHDTSFFLHWLMALKIASFVLYIDIL